MGEGLSITFCYGMAIVWCKGIDKKYFLINLQGTVQLKQFRFTQRNIL